jgi:hypothetical protein
MDKYGISHADVLESNCYIVEVVNKHPDFIMKRNPTSNQKQMTKMLQHTENYQEQALTSVLGQSTEF